MRRPLIGVLLLVALAVFLSWALFRVLGARGAATAARLMPARTLLFLEAPDVQAALAALRAAPPPGWPRIEHPLARWAAGRPVPGALGVWSGGGGLRWALALLDPGDPAGLAAALLGEPPAQSPAERTYRGDRYVLLPEVAGLEPCAGRIGRYLVLASEEAACREVLDAASGGASLDGMPPLGKARSHLETGGFLFGYVPLSGGAVEAGARAGSERATPERPSEERSLQAVAFQSRLGEAGWVDRFHVVTEPADPPLALGILRRPPCAPDPGEAFPADATLLVSLCAGDLEELYDEALEEIVSRMAPEEAAALRERIAGVEQLTGLRVRRDLMRALGRRFAAALAWDGSPRPLAGLPGLVVSLEVERPRDFASVLDRLSGFGRATGRLRRESIGGREVFTILPAGRRAEGEAPVLPAAASYVLDGSRFLAASTPGRLRAALEAASAGRTLAGEAEVRALRLLAPAEVNLMLLARPAPLAAWLTRSLPPGAGEGRVSAQRGALLWAVGRRDGMHGEVHAPFSVLLALGWRRLAPGEGRGSEAAREVGDHPVDVGAGLGERGQAAVLLDRLRSGVVGGEREHDVPPEAVEQAPEMAGTGVQVLLGIERIAHPHEPGRLRHELQQPQGARRRDGARLEVRLHPDHGGHEVRVERVARRHLADERPEALRRFRRSSGSLRRNVLPGRARLRQGGGRCGIGCRAGGRAGG